MRFLIIATTALLATQAVAQVSQPLTTGNPLPTFAAAAQRAERNISMPMRQGPSPFEDIGILRQVTTVPKETRDHAEDLIKQATAALEKNETYLARPKIAEATALLSGRTWGADQAFAASLALAVTEMIADPSEPVHAQLTQVYPAGSPTGLTMRLRLAVDNSGGGPNGPAQEDKTIRNLWTAPILTPDLLSRPLAFAADLNGAPDGAYLLTLDVLRGTTVVGSTRSQVRVVGGLLAAERKTRARLAAKPARNDLGPTILYPFDTARAVNGWRREVPENLDFAASIQRSDSLLSAWEKGDDTLSRRTGDQRRAYISQRSGETLPYHIYVPAKWRPGMSLPVVLTLHGGGLNEDSVFPATGRFAGLMQRLAEQHGMIIVSPLGYRPSGGYGVSYSGVVPPPVGLRPDVTARETMLSLSESDTMEVLDKVVAEYGGDSKRIYLVGNSMGGGGVWHLAAKYPERFAAVSPNASSMPFDRYDFTRLKTEPVRILVGELDAEVRRTLAKQAETVLKAQGSPVTLTVMPNETHTTAWYAGLPDTFAFFARN